MNGFLSAVELILSLLFIIVLAIVSIRLLGRKALTLSSNRYVRVVAAQTLGQNKALHTVIVDDKTVLLIGVGTHVELVARFDDEELAQKLTKGDQRNDTASSLLVPAFTWLTAKLHKDKTGEPQGSQTDFSVFLKERFEALQSKRREVLGEENSLKQEKPVGSQGADTTVEKKR